MYAEEFAEKEAPARYFDDLPLIYKGFFLGTPHILHVPVHSAWFCFWKKVDFVLKKSMSRKKKTIINFIILFILD